MPGEEPSARSCTGTGMPLIANCTSTMRCGEVVELAADSGVFGGCVAGVAPSCCSLRRGEKAPAIAGVMFSKESGVSGAPSLSSSEKTPMSANLRRICKT